jgi:glycolate oxidase subunit GlcD
VKVEPALRGVILDLSYFKEILGDKNVLDDDLSKESFGRDWTKKYEPNPSVVLLPKNTEEVSKIMKYCHDQNICVVPSGGRTGLAGGAVAANGEVVLSLNRMNKILDIDSVGMCLVTEAGVTTQEIQEAAANTGLFFPIDLAAKGSCQIGGNIATNAGGVKLIRFGGTREQVLGLEVVLVDGRVLDINTALRKNNTGYDLKQLFLGSEGTLGIVTKATLKLSATPRNVQLTLMATDSFDKIPQILKSLNQQGAQITAFEFFTLAAHEKVLKYTPNARTPFEEKSNFYVLLEIEEGPIPGKVLEPVLEKVFEEGLISDAVISSNSAQFGELWGLRENITESLAAHGHVRKNDVSLPIALLGGFVSSLEALMESGKSESSNIEMIVFGHIGDGNLHINYVSDGDESFEKFSKSARNIELRVFDIVKKFRGSISAEHGIGILKKQDLHYSCSEIEIEFMRKIKAVFDPKGILNPGKIFD